MSTIRTLVARLAAVVTLSALGDWSSALDIDADAVIRDLQYGRG